MIIKNEHIKFKTVKLKDVLTIRNGKSQKKIEDESGLYGIYGTGGLMGRTNSYMGQEKSIVIGRKGTIDNPLFMNEKYWVIDTAFYTDDFLYDSKYLYYIIKRINFHNYSKSAVIPSLTKNDLNEIDILVTEDFNYAKKLSLYLDKEFTRLEKINTLIKKIEIRNLYYADKLLNGELTIKNEKIVENSIPLNKTVITTLFDLKMGETILRNQIEENKIDDNFIPVYSATEENKIFGYIDKNKVKKILCENDMILAARGSIGSLKLTDDIKTSTQTTIQLISKTKYSSYLAFKYLENKRNVVFKPQGAAIPQITIDGIKDIEINLINNKEVEIFLRKMDEEKEKIEKLLKLEEKRFEWISDKLLSGEYIIED